MFTVSSGFMGDFKLGDNINHNLEILALLYRQQAASDHRESRLLCKPITLTIASICEAILSDFHMRISTYTNEGVKNVAESVLSYVRGKKIDEFEKFIASARKHDLLDSKDKSFYDSLDTLRKLRNRIHIQNTKKHFEDGEFRAFSPARQTNAEKALEKVAKTMADRYVRDESKTGFVEDFQFPWAEHFPPAVKATS